MPSGQTKWPRLHRDDGQNRDGRPWEQGPRGARMAWRLLGMLDR